LFLDQFSFKNLQTIDGHIYDTFKEAYLVKRLLENDNEWIVCLQEASIIQSASQLRNLFVTLFTHCSPNKLNNLWEQFRHKICDDFKHQL
jgi:hypothetical protein